MAERSVFISKKAYPFFEEIKVQFEWFHGFAVCQKQKNEISLHGNFQQKYPDEKIIEITSAPQFTTVESPFQSSRIYVDDENHIQHLQTLPPSRSIPKRDPVLFSLVLKKTGLLHKVASYESYLKLFRTTPEGTAIDSSSYKNVQLLDKKGNIHLLYPIVPSYLHREDVEKLYVPTQK